jgi:hypothetical protein
VPLDIGKYEQDRIHSRHKRAAAGSVPLRCRVGKDLSSSLLLREL